jgi:hypothetical protein
MSLGATIRARYEGSVRPRWRRPAASVIRSVTPLPLVKLDDVAPAITMESPILDDICMPPYFAFAHDDYSALMRIAAMVDPRLIVELGTAHGNTVANLCKQFPNANVVTVNAVAEEQTGEAITFSLAPQDIGRVYRQHGFGGRVMQLLQNTLQLDLSAHVAEGSVDLAIIDACHDAAFVENDFRKVSPYVRSGGMVLLHDTHPSMQGHLWGSYLACVRLRRRGYDIQHVKDTWWGIWRKS